MIQEKPMETAKCLDPKIQTDKEVIDHQQGKSSRYRASRSPA